MTFKLTIIINLIEHDHSPLIAFKKERSVFLRVSKCVLAYQLLLTLLSNNKRRLLTNINVFSTRGSQPFLLSSWELNRRLNRSVIIKHSVRSWLSRYQDIFTESESLRSVRGSSDRSCWGLWGGGKQLGVKGVRTRARDCKAQWRFYRQSWTWAKQGHHLSEGAIGGKSHYW